MSAAQDQSLLYKKPFQYDITGTKIVKRFNDATDCTIFIISHNFRLIYRHSYPTFAR